MAYYFIIIIRALILYSVFPGPSSKGRSKAKQMIPRKKECVTMGEAREVEREWGLDGRASGEELGGEEEGKL